MEAAVTNRINTIQRPTHISKAKWTRIKKTATLIWDLYSRGVEWKTGVEIPCEEFYQMLLDENGQCIIRDNTLIRWKTAWELADFVKEKLAHIETMVGQKNWEAAKEYNDRILKLSPGEAKAHYYKGLIAMNSRDFINAVNSFGRAVELDETLYDCYLQRSSLYSLWDMDREALMDLNKAIRQRPVEKQAYLKRGILRRSIGDHEGGTKDFQKVMQLDPSAEQRWEICNLLSMYRAAA